MLLSSVRTTAICHDLQNLVFDELIAAYEPWFWSNNIHRQLNFCEAAKEWMIFCNSIFCNDEDYLFFEDTAWSTQQYHHEWKNIVEFRLKCIMSTKLITKLVQAVNNKSKNIHNVIKFMILSWTLGKNKCNIFAYSDFLRIPLYFILRRKH